MTIEARNQTAIVSPSGQIIRVNAPPTRNAAASPDSDGQDVVGEELGVLVGEADAGRDAAGAVDELELVELVAERDRQQEQPAEDGEVDADRRGEDQPAARRTDEVAGEGQDAGRPTTMPLNSPWTRRRNGSSNRKKLMSRPKIGSVTRRGRRERDAVRSRAGPSPTPPTATPPMRSAMNRAIPPRIQPASGVRSGMSPASKVMAWLFAVRGRGRHRTRDRGPPRRSSAAWAASLIRSTSDRSEPAPSLEGGGASRPASHRLPRRTRREDERRHAQADVSP